LVLIFGLTTGKGAALAGCIGLTSGSGEKTQVSNSVLDSDVLLTRIIFLVVALDVHKGLITPDF
jgi:hypothetical protein